MPFVAGFHNLCHEEVRPVAVAMGNKAEDALVANIGDLVVAYVIRMRSTLGVADAHHPVVCDRLIIDHDRHDQCHPTFPCSLCPAFQPFLTPWLDR